jgi:hypothetical protein
MNPLKLFAVAALTALSGATSFGSTLVWGASGPAYYNLKPEYGSGAGATLLSDGQAVACLVYLGENVSSWQQNVPMMTIPGMYYEGSVVAEQSTDAAGEIGTGNTFAVTPGVAIGGTSGISQTLVDGQSSFGVMFISHEPMGLVRYYYGEIAIFNTSSASYSSETDSFSITATQSPGPNDLWDYGFIPEPTTASLTFLGLAMLIRRRRPTSRKCRSGLAR